jgi:GTP cyclohydrolase I
MNNVPKYKIEWTWKNVENASTKVANEIISYHLDNNKSLFLVYGVPRGGIISALQVVEKIKKYRPDINIELTNGAEQADFFIDDIIDSGKTEEYFTSTYKKPFFALYDKTGKSSTWISFPWEQVIEEKGVEDNILRILQYVGEDPTREGLVETPKRVVNSYETLYGGYHQNPEDILKTFNDDSCDEMVLLKDIEFYSTCEHHMLPFFGKAHIAYLPDGKVIGVSKLARLLEIFARRLQIQERLCQDITSTLDKILKPIGAACIIEAQHFCMTSRGVQKQKSAMITSSLTGKFRDDKIARYELLNLIKG